MEDSGGAMAQSTLREMKHAKAPAAQKGKRRDIQGLRALAVGAVILDHLLHWPSGGFVGVDVFFVISGFLITGLLLREHDRTGTISFANFYRSRVRRIIPASVLTLAVTATASFLLFNLGRAQQTLWDAIWSLFFSANWRFSAVGTDYFQAGGPVSPLQHFWSLAVEEQFYFVWPWLMLLIFVIGGKAAKWDSHVAHRAAGIAMALIVIVSFAWAVKETSENPTSAYFSTFSRAWELGVGALLAVFAGAMTHIPNILRPVLAWVGLAGIIGSMFVISSGVSFPAPWAALPVLSTALVIGAGTGEEQRFLWPLTNPLSQYIGDISFSLYLWHFPVIILLTSVMQSSTITYVITAIVLTAGLSIAAYHGVENRIRKSIWLDRSPAAEQIRRRRRRNRGRVSAVSKWQYVCLSVLASAALVVASIALNRDEAQSDIPLANSGAVSAAPHVSAATSDPGVVLTEQIQAALHSDDWPDLTPPLDSLGALNFSAEDSQGCAEAHEGGHSCDFSSADPAKLALIVGDSIAVAWIPTVRSALETQGWTVGVLAMVGCPFIDAPSRNSDEGLQAACPAQKESAMRVIEEQKPALVIASNSYGIKFDGQTGTASNLQLREEGLGSYFRAITSIAGKLIVLSPPPGARNPVECATPFSSPSDCATSVTEDWLAVFDSEQMVTAKSGGVFIDTRPWFCDRMACPAFVGKTTVRRDGVHITEEYAKMIAPQLSTALGAVGVG